MKNANILSFQAEFNFMNRAVIIIIGSFLLFCACRGEAKNEVIKEVKSKGLNQTIIAGDIRYEIMYRSAASMAAIGSIEDPGGAINDQRYREHFKQQEDYQYIIIRQRVHHKNVNVLKYRAENHQVYEGRVYYYNTDIIRDIRLFCEGAQLAPVASQYENNMDIIPYNTLIFAFEKCPSRGKSLKVEFDDIPLGNKNITAEFNLNEI
ncbi:MAG: hypothetical protein KL787_05630 [Taibaiella sp.]|nr:hypothetical protein [Taibaiella sp.]